VTHVPVVPRRVVHSIRVGLLLTSVGILLVPPEGIVLIPIAAMQDGGSGASRAAGEQVVERSLSAVHEARLNVLEVARMVIGHHSIHWSSPPWSRAW